MNISQSCNYALTCLLELSAIYPEGPMNLSKVANKYSFSLKFLQNTMRHLKSGGFVKSKKGPKGGFILGKSPQEIILGEVIRFMGVSKEGLIYSGDSQNENLFIRIWEEVDDAVDGVINNITFDDLLRKKQDTAQSWEMYYI